MSLPRSTPPAVEKQNAVRPRMIMNMVCFDRKVWPFAVAPTVTPGADAAGTQADLQALDVFTLEVFQLGAEEQNASDRKL